MKNLKKIYLFSSLLPLLITGCVSPQPSFLMGTWASYTPQGILSPTLNMHSFAANGNYVKISMFTPPPETDVGHAHLSVTGYQIEGSYLLKDKTLELTIGEEKTSWHCEREGDQLYLIDIDSEGTNVVLLTKISRQDESRDNFSAGCGNEARDEK